MTVLGFARVVTPGGVLDPGWVETAGGRISAVGTGQPPHGVDMDLGGQWLVPGFVDMHVHGGDGASFATGDADDARRVAEFHRRHGTTTLVASLVSARLEILERAVASLAELVEDGLLAGVHLEGPFLSTARCGAHDPAMLRPPAQADVERLLRAGHGTVRMITLAPELANGLDAVRAVVAHGAAAAIGHTDATYEVTRQAIEAGASVATHLFNGMRPVHHREPGPVLALLEDERITVELICDGIHLDPAVVRATAQTVGLRRLALVTDAIAAAGVGDGTYVLGGLPVRVAGGAAHLADGTSIAGSTLTTSAALRNAVRADIPVAEAVQALSSTPATALGLHHRLGAIRTGLDADLVVLDTDLTVQHVMAKGAWIT
ncbi:N-acetylglucosamine-6-phosphate deacetylase [Streptomyces sp. NPDC001530]|uniref:N-acetylglucosamine-6-phosphate deacetylase n=1 Tax=Streptomyces sp. NPDC001530 TaxID=3364582 RepID=UPI00369C1E47